MPDDLFISWRNYGLDSEDYGLDSEDYGVDAEVYDEPQRDFSVRVLLPVIAGR